MLGGYKVCLCFIVLSVTFCTVGYVCLFCGDQIFVSFVSFLSMIIYEILYKWCLRHNIYSAWFSDIRISTCFTTIFKNEWAVFIMMCLPDRQLRQWPLNTHLMVKCHLHSKRLFCPIPWTLNNQLLIVCKCTGYEYFEQFITCVLL